MSDDWSDDARCIEVDPEAFFPGKSDPADKAKEICYGCPVAEQCLTYALEHDERYGIWGGLSRGERKKLMRKKPNT